MKKKFRYLNRLCHHVRTINDGELTLVVFKRWEKTKQRWRYEVEAKWVLDRFAESS